jgi:hypothetical protein
LFHLNRMHKALKQRNKIPYLDKKNAIIRYLYVRYADDWVLFSNCSKIRTEFIKEKIKDFFGKELALNLFLEKTKITNAKKERIKFLGFSLCYYNEHRKIRGIKSLKNNNIHKRRTTGNKLVIGIDQDRLESRLFTKRFTNKDVTRGHRKTEWTVLSDHEIIMRYNYIIRGLVTYYCRVIRDFSLLNKYLYLLYYSCAHTLANKHRLSLKKIFEK